MAGPKRFRAWLVAAAIIFSVFYVTRWRTELASSLDLRPAPASAPPAQEPVSAPDVAPSPPHFRPDESPDEIDGTRPTAVSDDVTSMPRTTYAPTHLPQLPDAKLVKDAHTLASADDFMSHFWAVTQLPGISLAETKATCTWGPGDKVDFQFKDDDDWVVKDRPDQEIEQRRQEWQNFIRNGLIPYSDVEARFTTQRGLVVVAGNHDTVQRVALLLRALHKAGSRVAIEIHYFGAEEMSELVKQSLSSMWPRTFFNDMTSPNNILRVRKDGLLINYQLKTAALVNSRFREPLLLDSDNLPLLDPEELWDSDTYKKYGTVFWPDIARTRPQNPAWAITNTKCRMDEYEQESGQLLVDKRRFWYHLQLAAWWSNEHGRYYDQILLGDKDLFRFAWHALRTAYGRPRRWLASVGTLNDGFYCGHSFAQHHPDDDRVAFLHGGLVKTVSLEVMRWNREERGGYYRHYKRAPTDEVPGVSVNVGIKFDGAAYMPGPRSPDFHAAMCTDMYDVEAKDLNELIPMWEKSFEEIGGYWQLDKAKEGQGGKPVGF